MDSSKPDGAANQVLVPNESRPLHCMPSIINNSLVASSMTCRWVAAWPGSRLQQKISLGKQRHALMQGFPGGANEASGRQQLAGIHPGHPDYEQAARLYAQQQAQAHGTAGGASFSAAQVGMLCCNFCCMLRAPATPPHPIWPVVELGSPFASQEAYARFRWEIFVLTFALAHGASSGCVLKHQLMMWVYVAVLLLQQGDARQGPAIIKAGGSAGEGGQPDAFGLLGLLSVIRMTDPDLTTLALGTDLTTLGLNLNSPDNLHKTFASPWSDGPLKPEPEFKVHIA